ncbi:hypothetical protein LP417_34875 (plasmid) [Polaromonas sp. P1-6]|nr:hypothetical protein LP417_34875 [Polaromonas sp. P1-6]
MSLSFRRFLIAQDGSICRLANMKFDRMLRDPDGHRVPVFAGQRVRMADVVIELTDRIPVRVLRSTFAILTFDYDGRIDSGRFGTQQRALAESALAPALDVPKIEEKVLDVADRFIAQGGTWHPSSALARAIDEAALGRMGCRRL